MEHPTEDQIKEAKENSKRNEEGNGGFPLIAVFIEMMKIFIPAGIVIKILWEFLQAIGWL